MKKAIWILSIIFIIALAAVIYVVVTKKAKPTINEVPVINTTINTEAQAPVAIASGTSVQDKFRTEVPKDIKVPEVNEKISEELKTVVAVPTVVTPAAPGATQKYRSFNISANAGVYTPSSIIGNVDDTIHINFTAVDKDYDIVFPSYNMKQTAKKGETKVLQFQAVQEGSFTYYCQMCGGENGPTKGSIIIKK